MTVLVRYQPTSMNREVYDAVNEALGRLGQPEPPELRVHVMFGEGSNLKVSEVWQSEEIWRHWYDAVLRDAFTEVGLDMPTPEVIAVQELWGSALQPA